MARPAHPGEHDPKVREHLETCLEAEVLIPCPDKATALLLRSKFYSLVRAHKLYKTAREHDFNNLSTKILASHRVMAVRPKYSVDPSVFPLTFILDGRGKVADVLDLAVVNEPPSPISRAPENSAHGDFDDDFTFDDGEDPYLAIASRYRNLNEGS